MNHAWLLPFIVLGVLALSGCPAQGPEPAAPPVPPDSVPSPELRAKLDKAARWADSVPAGPAVATAAAPLTVESSALYRAQELAEDGLHDPASPAIGRLQSPVTALAPFPVGPREQIDWVQTLKQGHINPRADLKGETTMQVLDLDLLMSETKTMPFVKFPHQAHTQWLACSNCHPEPFQAKVGSNDINMNEIFRGRFCGQCHGRVAFSLYICERCHSVAHGASPGAWWK
ncbi:MAG: hypothetical protein HQL51_02090 [Magnetococcales bacterium]|nr:hypothetical protein [Magnetococcales bacterium]